MKSKLLITVVVFLISCIRVYAQQIQKARNNTVSVCVGRTNYVNGSFKSIGYGADYLRRIAPRWEVGMQMDFNVDRSEFKLDGVAFVPVVAFALWKNAQIFSGVGIEHGVITNHTVVLLRLGGEYPVFLNKQRSLFFIPGIFLDYFEGELKPSVMVGMGYTF